MADNVAISEGSGKTIATDDVSGAQYQWIKVDLGGDGVASPLIRGQQSTANSVPVALSAAQEAMIDGLETAIASTNTKLDTLHTDAASIDGHVDGLETLVTSSNTKLDTLHTDITGTLVVASHAVTNAGTFATQAAQSGTWTVQPGNTANTTAWKVDGSAVTQPISVASIPSHAVTNAGTFAVQVTSVPALAAGTNNIGDIDVLSLPAIPSGSNTIGAITNVPLTNMGAGEYETVAASQTAQVLGPTGGTGDYIDHLLVIPATTSPGNVLLLDNATSITVFVGGASSVATLHPFTIDLRMISVSGAWKVTTGANVSVIGVGNFT